MTEQDRHLPLGWAHTDLGTLGEYVNGRGFKKSEWRSTGRPIIRIQDLTGTGGTPNYFQGEVDSKHEVAPRDLLVSWAATLGAYIWHGPLAVLNQHIFRVKSYINKQFHYYALSWAIEDLYRNTHGTGMVHVTKSKFEKTRVPLPPLGEQQRIVDSIETEFTKLDAAVAGLEHVQANLKRYRASVLKAAVEGRLVPTEADLARQQGRTYEPAKVLLDRILAERRRCWEDAELERLKAKGKAPSDDRWKVKYKEPAVPETEDLPELPEGWCWVTWSQIGFSQNGRAFPSKEYQDEGVKLLRPGNLHVSGRVDWTEKNTRRLPESWAIEYPGFTVGTNELVMNLTAQSLADEFLGRICLTGSNERCLLNQRIARLTPIVVRPSFVLWLFRSPWFRRFVDSLNTGSLIQHMFTSQLDEFPLPLPPLGEQDRMVAEVERLMSHGEDVERVAAENETRCGHLRQSILKWAFEGRLVDQDPKEEPATSLLARIREPQERQGDTAGAQRRRVRSRK